MRKTNQSTTAKEKIVDVRSEVGKAKQKKQKTAAPREVSRILLLKSILGNPCRDQTEKTCQLSLKQPLRHIQKGVQTFSDRFEDLREVLSRMMQVGFACFLKGRWCQWSIHNSWFLAERKTHAKTMRDRCEEQSTQPLSQTVAIEIIHEDQVGVFERLHRREPQSNASTVSRSQLAATAECPARS